MAVVIETTIGDITVDLYLDKRPQTCLNFLKLCKMKYYNLCLFHKIEKNFIAQTGDPSGTGRGGESVFCHLYGDQAKYFEAEFKPRLKHEKLGTLSMVNNGNNMNGSQFFLTLTENLTYLDENHTVFGEVAEGFEVLVKLNNSICDNNNRPYQDIRITHTVILHDPYEDPNDLEIPDRSPEPSKEMLESGYIGADEEIDDVKGKSAEEIEEKIKESEAKARATILEMVGDIPEADVKPPENVLFVCKLNPVTTSEDLEVIFSRFGPIVSCEVIKDKKSGESLQYAFIEFEKEEHCENAYFKMDNVLIDDRRIHVDFSQSVSKMNWNKDNSKGSKFDNIILKDKSKKNDGYDLIFDMDNSEASNDERQISSSKDRRTRSKSPSRHKNYSDRNINASRNSDKRKKELDYNDRTHKSAKYEYHSSRERQREQEYYSLDKSRDAHKYPKDRRQEYDRSRDSNKYHKEKSRDSHNYRKEINRPYEESPSRSKQYSKFRESSLPKSKKHKSKKQRSQSTESEESGDSYSNPEERSRHSKKSSSRSKRSSEYRESPEFVSEKSKSKKKRSQSTESDSSNDSYSNHKEKRKPPKSPTRSKRFLELKESPTVKSKKHKSRKKRSNSTESDSSKESYSYHKEKSKYADKNSTKSKKQSEYKTSKEKRSRNSISPEWQKKSHYKR